MAVHSGHTPGLTPATTWPCATATPGRIDLKPTVKWSGSSAHCSRNASTPNRSRRIGSERRRSMPLCATTTPNARTWAYADSRHSSVSRCQRRCYQPPEGTHLGSGESPRLGQVLRGIDVEKRSTVRVERFQFRRRHLTYSHVTKVAVHPH